MIYPTFTDFCRYADEGRTIIPIMKEIAADTETPISIFLKMEEGANRFLLESVENGEKWGRYSFMGSNPKAIFSLKNGKGEFLFRDGSVIQTEGEPMQILRSYLKDYSGPQIAGSPGFTGGAIGYFAYDTVRYMENIPDDCLDDIELPDTKMLIIDELIAFDHLRQKIVIIANAETEGDRDEHYRNACSRLEDIDVQLHGGGASFNRTRQSVNAVQQKIVQQLPGKEEFMNNVLRAKEYIVNGDIFQVVLSRRIDIESNVSPFSAYRALRSVNPSPYMFYLDFGDMQLAGASPEMLVRLTEDKRVETCPIAGTRPRGKDAVEDALLKDELLADEKETAEHMMLLDLGRNDIGRVSKFGSVQVDRMKEVEYYSHVMHIVSNVSGEIKDGCDAFDALRSVLPAGTLSGAPKVRAMEIIDELEEVRRGTYGGAVGYIGFDGRMDSCITIRTLLFQKGHVYMQSGAGIVYDSDPETEFLETENKVKVLLRAMESAEVYR